MGWTAAIVALVWLLAALIVGLRRRPLPLGPIMAVEALAIAATVWASRAASDGTSVTSLQRWSAALAAGVGIHLLLGLPDGRLTDRFRRTVAVLGYVAAAALAASWTAGWGFEAVAIGVLGGLALIGVGAYADRCRRAGPVDRVRLQWAGWGVVVAGLIALVAFILNRLLEWPPHPGAVFIGATALLPISLALSSFDRLAVRIDRLLMHTIVVAGLVVLVASVYLVVVLGLGDVPDDAAQRLLALSMVAALIAAVLTLPARRRLDEFAHRRVYGERRSPDEALQTFGSRMSRAVPMDELLLQLAETLKLSMNLVAAEVWTGLDGKLERVVSVPERGSRRIAVSGEELTVVSRARVSGNAWLAVWMPQILEGRSEALLRVAPIAHSGNLLGLLVVERAIDAIPFEDEEERVLTELARQVGLALHNVRLDSELQASLQELQERNAQLQASRLRIVTAADESRRRIERDLHDGAQQHLVALAVKIGLVRQLVDADPATAMTLLEELRGDAQATLTELRELAHGIYPPLLRDRGLAEALRTASNRAVLDTEVVADGVGRYSSEVEAAVYFCCLEAMQNAGKHAGDGSEVTVSVNQTNDELVFEIADNGAGFEPSTVIESHGFENMRDRLGAVAGQLEILSSVGHGSRVVGRIRVEPQP